MSFRASEVVAFLLLCWSAISLLWSPDSPQGAFQLSHAAVALLLYWGLVRLPERAVEYAVLPGVALSIVGHLLLLWMLPTPWYGGFGNKNFGAEFLLAAIPLSAAALWHDRRLRLFGISACLAGIIALFTVYTNVHAKYVALLTLGVGIAVWLVWRKFYLLAAIVVLGPIDVAVMYGVTAWSLSSVRTRLELWTNTLALWLEKPWFGQGFGSFNHEYPRFQEFHLGVFPEMGTLLNQPAMFSGAAHSEPLQLLAELGVVGFVFAALFIGVLLRSRFKAGTFKASDYGALGCLALIAGAGLVGFPLQNPSTMALAVVALAVLARHEPVLISFHPQRFAAAAVALPIGIGLGWIGWTHYEARVSFSETRARMEANDLGGAFIANLRAVEMFPYDWLPRFQLGLTLSALAVHDTQSSIEPGAADRIYEISRSASPYAPMTLYARVAYLNAANRVDERAEEIETILASLKSTATLQPPTWLTEMWFAQNRGDRGRAAFAQWVASDPRVLGTAGHDYPSVYRAYLHDLAERTREALEKTTP